MGHCMQSNTCVCNKISTCILDLDPFKRNYILLKYESLSNVFFFFFMYIVRLCWIFDTHIQASWTDSPAKKLQVLLCSSVQMCCVTLHCIEGLFGTWVGFSRETNSRERAVITGSSHQATLHLPLWGRGLNCCSPPTFGDCLLLIAVIKQHE